jgi:hypothetical protein
MGILYSFFSALSRGTGGFLFDRIFKNSGPPCVAARCE